MDVGDGCVYEMDMGREVVNGDVEMGKGMEVGSDMLVEGKYRWNGGNRDIFSTYWQASSDLIKKISCTKLSQ